MQHVTSEHTNLVQLLLSVRMRLLQGGQPAGHGALQRIGLCLRLHRLRGSQGVQGV
jgi:hypothetical protein